MSTIPENDQKLVKHMIHFIRNGIVEEVLQREEHLTVRVSLIHKSEKYVTTIHLCQDEWQFGTIEYAGQISRNRNNAFLLIGTSLAAILLASFFWFDDVLGELHRWTAAESSPDNEQRQNVNQNVQHHEESSFTEEHPVLDEEDLIRIAAEYNYALISEEEYQNLLDKIEELYEMKEGEKQQVIEEQEAQIEEVQTISFHVQPGMSAWSIANQLEKIGLIDNARELQTKFKEHEIAYRIRTGTYLIQENLSYDEIIEVFRSGPQPRE